MSCEPALLHAAPFAKIETEVVPTRTKEVVGPILENSFTAQPTPQPTTHNPTNPLRVKKWVQNFSCL